MLISKNQRLCGVLDKIDTVIVEGTKMTHTQVPKKPSQVDVIPWCYKWMDGWDWIYPGGGIDHNMMLIIFFFMKRPMHDPR